MNLFLYVQITNFPEDVKFYNPIVSNVKQQNLDIVTYDLDNHSDSLIIGFATKLLNDSAKTVIFIETTPDTSVVKLLPLLTNILDNPDRIEIILKGDNSKLEKMLSILPQLKISENTYEIEPFERIIAKIFQKMSI
ncbi:MAG: hypothetical protein V4585_19985 [Bacteroidota bacterium]|jgi:hypothetical protein